ncbi:polysaccharide deacetylase [Candidatus Nitrosopumilus koreensis AR1]|uniref:Polysaccharide deacetylase n=1 Tax=Candidatus Nitrosopumilus koreensis AR1 TaxID=1229908 RepID=K0B7C2_9ARCH|nr:MULTISPECIES: polysaccharide deacetylase family protein [Nitrosopumilus]AFS80356.1 polysaccharide deacetylase [Candidatus Nitrosopumilus koreensis AR1]
MNIKIAGAISTGLIIVLAVVLVMPPFLSYQFTPQHVLLLFTIDSKKDTSSWCTQLSQVLEKHDATAAIFLSGSTAEQHPDCITSFSDEIDIGSQGYTGNSIPLIPDYSDQLEEVKKGKQVIDEIGNFDSKLFKSPYGDTDQNIYSLLEKSGILADFSYDTQYNKFHNGQFIWFTIESYDANSFSIDDIPTKSSERINPIIINFENNIAIDEIDDLLSDVKKQRVTFVSASDLVGFELNSMEGL